MASDLKTRIVHFCQYLQDPQHVARFQQICGVRGTFSRNLCGRQAEQRHNGACMNHHYFGESENDSVNGGGDGERGDGRWLRKKTTTGNSLKQDVCKNGLRNGAVLTPGAGESVGCGPNSCCFGEAVVDGEAKETSSENCPNDACGVDYLREKNAGEVNETLSHRHTVKARRKNSLTGDIGQEFLIENKFLFYIFTLGTELGNELFYITFFPFLIWNIDPYVSRRLILIWVWVMYLGQCTKDVIRWSRPASPPVVKVEMFYNSEYSMPSTHAMSGTAIPFSLFLLTYGRWEYSFVSGLLLAFTWCGLVCVSRIYMGMHSILDVLVGFFYSILILVVFQPALDVIDNFHLTCGYAPLLITSLHLGLGIFSFTLDNWSTSRGDTAQILGTGAGIALASHLNHRLGLLPDLPAALLPIYPPPLSVTLVARSLLRLLVGVPVLLATRALMKALTIPLVCRIFGIPSGDVRKARQHMQVELPYRYIVYGTVGFNCLFLVPFLFSHLNLS